MNAHEINDLFEQESPAGHLYVRLRELAGHCGGKGVVDRRRGDRYLRYVVCFSIYTIHGSYINTTDKARRMMRVGYRDPHNVQTAGQSLGRPGLLVRGYRDRQDGQQLFKQD